jgi:GRF zinc finger.
MQDSQHDIAVGMDEEEDDVQLQFALQMSLESRDNIRELFSSLVFKHLLRSTVTDLSDTQNQRRYYSFFIMNLLLTIVSKCSRSDQKPDLRRSMVEILCAEIGTLSKNVTEEFASKSVYTITLYLRSLSSLLTEQDSITSRIDLYPSAGLQHTERSSTPTKNKTDPRFICETHGVPAVRRRCSHGEHKDRRFYVCGMNRKNRCKYFKWADEIDTKPKANEKSATSQSAVSTKNEPVVNKEVRSIVWNFINSGNVPLHQQLCMLLQGYIKKKVNLSDSIHSQTDVDSQKRIKIQKLSKSLQSSLRNIQELQNDGSILSLRKLGSLDCPGAFELPFSQDEELQNLVLHKYPIVEALLDFIMLLGTKLSEVASNKSISWDIWYSPLCHIISKGFPAGLRNRAKEALKCVTGGNKDTYSQVRDRYLFASQFIDLLSCSESPLQAALAVREKAHRCGTSLYSNIASWTTLTTGELLGVQDLISEDYFALSGMKKLMKVLSILATTVSKSRRENWRYFCSLGQLPNKDTVFELEHNLDSSFLAGEIQERSPITVLFWMACALPEYAQVKLIPLINVALAGSFHIKSGKVSPTNDKTTDKRCVTEAHLNTRRQYDDHTPEKILLEGSYGLSLNDVCAFTAAFVLNSGNSQIRNHAKEIVLCLILSFPLESLQLFLQRMATKFITDMCSLGAQSIQFLQLITAIVTSGRIEKIDTTHLSRVAISCFTEQATENRTIASKMNRNLFTFLVKNNSAHNCGLEESFDLSRCTCCQSSIVRKRESNTLTETHALSQQPSFPDASKVRENESSLKWVDGQISEYKRVQIDHHRMICSEFNSYIQLKRRLAIHEIFLNVSDQRGRFVKTITVYFSPRHVNDINELRDDYYDPLWQPCGTFTLARGANKASLKVPFGVIAANLKFEYSEFYDKVNGGRTSAGAMVLHCPRCSRIVNTALGGVCGHCGEVAFQCRKCRHINYDRLDAFLCVECGYCSSGTFSYEMNAGEATSAVSILDEDDLEKMVRTLHTQQKKYEEILSIFKKHIYVDKKFAGRKRSHPNKSMNREIDCSDGAFKRMLQGKFPKLTIDTAEVGREESEAVSQTAPDARTRSLLDLASQIRGDFSSDIRTSLSDILVQQARFNSGFRSNHNFDDVQDETNILSIDMQDPLSQLVASIQARNRGVSSSSNNGRPIDSKSGTRENKDKSLDILKYCYLELKGIEKDCSEISKRIIAWKRLNQDSLADYGSITKSLHSLPVECSECAPKVTASLLELIRELIPRNFNGLEKMLTNKFISCLFDGQSTDSNELAELKKTVLLKIHQHSTMGSDMILEELNARLHGRKDSTSAEILGFLLQHDSVSHQKFVQFAVKMLGG